MTGKSLTTELQELDAKMTRLGSLVETAFTEALAAVERGNRDKACAVVVGDRTIDDLHLAIQQQAFRTLISHQPLAERHVRYLTSLVPITNEWERIADEAEGMAQIVLRMVPAPDEAEEMTSGVYASMTTDRLITQAPEKHVMQQILALGQAVRSLLQRTIKAFADRDAQAARSIWQEDREVNKGHYRVSQDLLSMLEGTQAITALTSDPQGLQQVTYLLWIAYKLERMADHCTNICESIVFLVEDETDIYATLGRD